MSRDDYETVRCLNCRKPSFANQAGGHVVTLRGRKILATFCSRRCARELKTVRRPGCFGQYKTWMGMRFRPSLWMM